MQKFDYTASRLAAERKIAQQELQQKINKICMKIVFSIGVILGLILLAAAFVS
jgi:hypothetical protein